MKGAARWSESVPAGTYERVDLLGSAWQSLAGLPPPQVWAIRPGLDMARLVGAWVGSGAALVEGSVYVERQPGEPYFAGLDDSFVARIARLHGTSKPWRLRFEGDSV